MKKYRKLFLILFLIFTVLLVICTFILVKIGVFGKTYMDDKYFEEINYKISNERLNLEVDFLEDDTSFSTLYIDGEEFQVYIELEISLFDDEIIYFSLTEIDEFNNIEEEYLFDMSFILDEDTEKFNYKRAKINENATNKYIKQTHLQDLELEYTKIDLFKNNYEPYLYNYLYFESEDENLILINKFSNNRESLGIIYINDEEIIIMMEYLPENKFKIYQKIDDDIDYTKSISGSYTFDYPNLKLNIEINEFSDEEIGSINLSKTIYNMGTYEEIKKRDEINKKIG